MSRRPALFATLLALVLLVATTSAHAAATDRILLDNQTAGSPHVFTATGAWSTQNAPTGFQGDNFLVAAAGAPSTAARWRPSVTTSGYYRLYARWSAAPDRARRAPLEINYGGGAKTDATRTLDQTINGGVWVQVGTYFLAAGTGNSVVLRPAADGTVAADAFLFELAHATSVSPTQEASVTPRVEYANADWRLNPRQVDLVRTDSAAPGVAPQFELRVDGEPFEVRGACGHEAVAPIAAAGGNTLRIYSVNPLGDVEDYLKAASDAGLKVMLGLFLTAADPGPNRDFYEDPAKVEAQFNAFKAQIDAYKHCEAILAWSIGNEIDPADHPNPAPIYRAIDQIARYIQDTDHYHPTVTSHAGSHQNKIAGIKAWAPQVDIIGINSYERNIGNVYSNVLAAGWTGPYLITEFSIEQPQQRRAADGNVTTFGSVIELPSAEKFVRLPKIYLDHILSRPDRCLGSFAFKGAKGAFRITHTWYPLLDENFKPTPSYDAMRLAWGGPPAAFTAPRVHTITINGLAPSQSVTVDDNFTAAVTVSADPGAELQYLVEVRPEVAMSSNYPAPPLTHVAITQDENDPRVFQISKAGLEPNTVYRLYYYVRQLDATAPHGYNAVGTANIPFRFTGTGEVNFTGDVVAEYLFGASGDYRSTVTSALATAGDLVPAAGGSITGTGLHYFKNNSGNGIPESLPAALSANHYLGFTVTPSSAPVNFQGLRFQFGLSNSTSTADPYTGSWAVFSSATGFASANLLATGNFSQAKSTGIGATWQTPEARALLADRAALQNVAGPVEFRIYFWDNLATSTTNVIMRFDTIELLATGSPPEAPTIATPPASQTVTEGEPARFSVSVSGTAPFTFQWQKDGVNLTDDDRFSGTASASLAISATLPADAGAYTVVVSNAADSVVSPAATLAVTPLPPTDAYSAWRAAAFTPQELDAPTISCALADPDGDGLANLVEYALGLDPKQAEAHPLHIERAGSEWIVRYSRPADRSDLTYTIEYSTTLSGWSSEGLVPKRTTAGESETWQARLPLDTGPHVFFRLAVARP